MQTFQILHQRDIFLAWIFHSSFALTKCYLDDPWKMGKGLLWESQILVEKFFFNRIKFKIYTNFLIPSSWLIKLTILFPPPVRYRSMDTIFLNLLKILSRLPKWKTLSRTIIWCIGGEIRSLCWYEEYYLELNVSIPRFFHCFKNW